MPHDAALQDRPDARVRREPARLRSELARPRPEPARRRSRPRPEDTGFGRRFVFAASFGSVLHPVNMVCTSFGVLHPRIPGRHRRVSVLSRVDWVWR